jgi:hypothetical protein
MPVKVVDEFGDCCSELRDALNFEAEPMVRINEQGALFMTVGMLMTEEGPAFYDHAVLFCPFCGTKLQDRGNPN